MKAIGAHQWDKQPEGWYVEEEWCDDRLFETQDFGDTTIYDPACGLGRIPEAAQRYGYNSIGSDKIARSKLHYCDFVVDFLTGTILPRPNETIVSNPPFGLEREFFNKAISITSNKVVFLLPFGYLCGDTRSRWLETTPLQKVLILTPRPSMPPGYIIEAGIKPTGGKVDFAWYVWDKKWVGNPMFQWLHRDA